MIIMLRNNIDFIFLSILTDVDNVIILLIIKALNKFIITVIKLAVLELAVKEQFIVNQQINLC